MRLLADVYAKAGFTAYSSYYPLPSSSNPTLTKPPSVPDVHSGDSLPFSFLQDIEPPLSIRSSLSVSQKSAANAKVSATLGPWLVNHRESVSKPIIDGFIRSVRKIPGVDKVGTIGFCWGGRYTILSTHATDPSLAVDAAYACHPSLVAIPGDFEPVARPLALALGEKDSLLGEQEIAQIREIMEGKKEGVESEVRVHRLQVHGFSLRGDWSSETDKKAMDEAQKQGIEWFRRFLVC